MNTNPERYKDSFFAFDAGVNAGIAPILLPPNQLAAGMDITLRGNLVRNRPNFIPIDMGAPDPNFRGLFQGAEVYVPDAGDSSIIVQISGRLYKITPSDVTATVVDITPTGDPNPANIAQCWMWQAEKWMIVQVGDPDYNPIFYDGTSSVRSTANAAPYGQVSLPNNQFTVPAIGSEVTITLDAKYEGPVDKAILIGTQQYKVKPTTAGYGITLTNINAVPGDTLPIGTRVIFEPGNFGKTTAAFTIPAKTYSLQAVNISDPPNTLHATGQAISEYDIIGQVASASYPPSGIQTLTIVLSSKLPPELAGQTVIATIWDNVQKAQHPVSFAADSQQTQTSFIATWLNSADQTALYLPPIGSSVYVVLSTVAAGTGYPALTPPRIILTLNTQLPPGLSNHPLHVYAGVNGMTMQAYPDPTQTVFYAAWDNPAFSNPPQKVVGAGTILLMDMNTVKSFNYMILPAFFVELVSDPPAPLGVAGINGLPCQIGSHFCHLFKVPASTASQYQGTWDALQDRTIPPTITPGMKVNAIIGSLKKAATYETQVVPSLTLNIQTPLAYSVTHATINGFGINLAPTASQNTYLGTWDDLAQRTPGVGDELRLQLPTVHNRSYSQLSVQPITVVLKAPIPSDITNTILYLGTSANKADGSAIKITLSTSPAGRSSITGTLDSGVNPGWTPQTDAYVLLFNTAPQTVGNVGTSNIPGYGFQAPAIGATVTIPLQAPFTGTANQQLSIGGGRYRAGTNAENASGQVQVTFTVPFPGASGDTILIDGNPYLVDSIVSTYSVMVHPTTNTPAPLTVVSAGRTVAPSSPKANALIGVLLAQSPAIPAADDTTSFQVIFKDPLSGSAGIGSVVWILGSAYHILSNQGGSGGSISEEQIIVINLTDTVGNKVPAGPTGTPPDTGIALLQAIPELPPGRMGTYGMGRVWMSLTDGRTYIAGDIVGGSSGTADSNNNNRDSVLKVTENTFLANGGAFVVPASGGMIWAMRFVAILDSSLGQGPLAVLTPTIAFSCQAPVDRTTWNKVTNPIQTISLITNGALSQESSITANGDLIFRSSDGLRSLILARREFATWGNVPISREVGPTLAADDQSLLQFASAIVFDNRLLCTANPSQTSNGVIHPRLVALNFDPVSSLRGKAESIYDGIWSGYNFLRLVTGLFDGVQRAFAFVSDSGTIKLIEILPDGIPVPDAVSLAFPPQYSIESPVLFRTVQGKQVNDFIRLDDGELYLDQIVEGTAVRVLFRPDYDTTWHLWTTIAPTPPYQPRIGLGSCPTTSDTTTGRPWRDGYAFQIRIEVVGQCRIIGARFYAVDLPDPKFAPMRGNRFNSPNTAPPVAPTPTPTPQPIVI